MLFGLISAGEGEFPRIGAFEVFILSTVENEKGHQQVIQEAYSKLHNNRWPTVPLLVQKITKILSRIKKRDNGAESPKKNKKQCRFPNVECTQSICRLAQMHSRLSRECWEALRCPFPPCRYSQNCPTSWMRNDLNWPLKTERWMDLVRLLRRNDDEIPLYPEHENLGSPGSRRRTFAGDIHSRWSQDFATLRYQSRHAGAVQQTTCAQ